MELLSRDRFEEPLDQPARPRGLGPRARRRASWAAGIAAAVSAAGCALTGLWDSGPKVFAFSHALHVGREQLECVNCHEDASVSDQPGMPAFETCAFCHEEIDAEKEPGRQVASLFDGGTFRAARVTALSDEVGFSHVRHAEALGSCTPCHQEVESGERVTASMALAMVACTDCHEERGQPTDCSACHLEIGQDWAPESHHQNWKRVHGRVFRSESRATADRCSLCHQESTCMQCHREELPASHTPLWRLRAHGVAAMLDRASCATCHESDTCQSCHTEVEPASHAGPWGGTKSTHCLGCHFPLQSNGCSVCHQGTPSHAAATPKPAWHTPAMNCLGCHGQGQDLPHVTKGDNCNLCHL